MTSSLLFEGDIMCSAGYGSLFSDETYTTVVFMSFRMSAFIFGVCFSTFIYFSFEFNKKFQHVQIMDNRKWAIAVLSYVIDMTCANSSTTFALQKKYDPSQQDSFEYCYTLLYQLVKPFI